MTEPYLEKQREQLFPLFWHVKCFLLSGLVTPLPQRIRQWHIVSPALTSKYLKNMSTAEK